MNVMCVLSIHNFFLERNLTVLPQKLGGHSGSADGRFVYRHCQICALFAYQNQGYVRGRCSVLEVLWRILLQLTEASQLVSSVRARQFPARISENTWTA